MQNSKRQLRLTFDVKTLSKEGIIEMIKFFKKNDERVYLWAVEGMDYAYEQGLKYGVDTVCDGYLFKKNEVANYLSIDICFDTEETLYGRANVTVV